MASEAWWALTSRWRRASMPVSRHCADGGRSWQNTEFFLAIVSGDMIEGTITPRLLERMDRGMTAARRDRAGPLPTVAEFSRAIADAATEETSGGDTIFVGTTL